MGHVGSIRSTSAWSRAHVARKGQPSWAYHQSGCRMPVLAFGARFPYLAGLPRPRPPRPLFDFFSPLILSPLASRFETRYDDRQGAVLKVGKEEGKKKKKKTLPSPTTSGPGFGGPGDQPTRKRTPCWPVGALGPVKSNKTPQRPRGIWAAMSSAGWLASPSPWGCPSAHPAF